MKQLLIFISWIALTAVAVSAQPENNPPKDAPPLHVLVLTKTVGFRHASISNGAKMIMDLAPKRNWVVTITENAELFNKKFLSTIDVIVFLNSTGDVLNEEQQKAMKHAVQTNKTGFVGIHGGSDCEMEWQWFAQLVGALFKTHPPAQKATIIIEDDSHPAMLPFKGMKTVEIVDEWYTFDRNPRKEVNVLASLDESSIKNGGKGEWKMGDHPLIWYHEKFGGRAFYSVFGHTPEQFENKPVIEHFTYAIEWAGKRIK